MKKFVLALVFVVFSGNFAFAMDVLDFSDFDSVEAIESEFNDFNRAVYAGMNALTWTTAKSPTYFGMNVNLVSGFGSFKANPAIGLKDSGIIPAGAAFQVGFGSGGFEIYARMLPEVNMGSDLKTDIYGFGLKYSLTSFLDAPGLPDVALYGEHNQFGLEQNRRIRTQWGHIDSGVDLTFKSTNFGVLVSQSLVALRVYGKAGIQSGTTDMMWNQAVEGGITNRVRGELTDSEFAYAVGLSLAGLQAEVGGRGSNLSFGFGWGMRF